ncbi:hypothetical protein [Microbacterium panaciterrae]
MTQLASRPEDEVRHALEVLGGADVAIVAGQLTHMRVTTGGFLESLRGAATYRVAVSDLGGALASLTTTVDPATARAAQATETVWRGVERDFGLFSSSAVGEILGASKSNRAYASALRQRGELLGMQRKNAYVFPGFQFDRPAGEIRPWVRPLLALAAEHERSAADVIAWMMSPTTYLGGDRPVDRVTDPERLLSVAERAWGVEW